MPEPTFEIPREMLSDKILDAYKNPPHEKDKHEQIQWLTVVLGYIKLAIDQMPEGMKRADLYNKWNDEQAAADRLHTHQQGFYDKGPEELKSAQNIDADYIRRVQSLIGDVVQALSSDQSPRT